MTRPNEIKNIRAKTLVIAGEKDALAHIEDSQQIVYKIRHAIFEVIPKAGHLFNYEDTKKFNSLVVDFLLAEEK